jgi:hypothetical protein
LQTITDEVGSGPISISTPYDLDEDGRADERNLAPPNENVTPALDDDRRKIEISYRPDQPLPHSSLVSTLDNGRCPQPSNDNRPARYHLRELAQRGELGINEPENRRHWFDAERLKRDIAISTGEPLNNSAANDWRELMMPSVDDEPVPLGADADGLTLDDDLEFQDNDAPGHCAVVDNAEGECDQIRFLEARQIVSLIEDVLGHDYKVLTSAIVKNWTCQMIGEDEGFMNRATASGCGKGMLRSSLRNLSRFYLKLDLLESGQRPHDVWHLIGLPRSIPPIVHAARPYRWHGESSYYLNQKRGPVIKMPESAVA